VLWVLVLSVCMCAYAQTSPTVGNNVGQQDTKAATVPPDSVGLEILKKELAAYPAEAAQEQLQGQVVIKVVVSETGDVEDAQVVTGNPVLAKAALEAARKFKFKPYIRNGKPVKVATNLAFNFAFTDKVRDVRQKDSEAGSFWQRPCPAADSIKLEALNQAKAPYPEEALKSKLEDAVTVRVLISDTGEVDTAHSIGGNPKLADAALTAVKQWKFKTWRDGKYVPVPAWADVEFDFKLPANLSTPGDNPPEISGIVLKGGEAPKSVRVSQGVTTGLLIHKVDPIYPPVAKAARIQGTVVLSAMIGKDGTIQSLRAVSGPRELQEAAIGAVQQWRYRPYLLMGEPVQVNTTITVNFVLSF